MNEIILLGQIAIVTGACFGAARYGKEALVSLIALQAVIANLLVLKQVHLFGLHVTCSDAFAVGTILALNLLQDRFGREASQKATWIAFGSMLFFAVVTQIHLLYTPSQTDTMQVHYLALLNPAPRLFAASLAAFFIVLQVDIRLYGWLKFKFPDWTFTARSVLSLLFTQALDTALFSVLGLWGLVDSIWNIFIFSYFMKVLVIGVSALLPTCAAFIHMRK